MRRAPVKSALLMSDPVMMDDSKFAPLKSANGPTMYAPLASFVIKRYGLGSTAGGFALTSPPERIYVSVDGNIACDISHP